MSSRPLDPCELAIGTSLGRCRCHFRSWRICGSFQTMYLAFLSGIAKTTFSATHLVQLNLTNIPHSGYISPEAIVAYISAAAAHPHGSGNLRQNITIEFTL